MKLGQLLSEAVEELNQEEKTLAKGAIKMRLREIKKCKETLAEMETSLNKLLAKDVREFSSD